MKRDVVSTREISHDLPAPLATPSLPVSRNSRTVACTDYREGASSSDFAAADVSLAGVMAESSWAGICFGLATTPQA
jgi:hypothetical protein